jgi:hypothetical protein
MHTSTKILALALDATRKAAGITAGTFLETDEVAVHALLQPMVGTLRKQLRELITKRDACYAECEDMFSASLDPRFCIEVNTADAQIFRIRCAIEALEGDI